MGVHIKAKKISSGNYFVLSPIIVDREGLNMRSLKVSIKAFGADEVGGN